MTQPQLFQITRHSRLSDDGSPEAPEGMQPNLCADYVGTAARCAATLVCRWLSRTDNGQRTSWRCTPIALPLVPSGCRYRGQQLASLGFWSVTSCCLCKYTEGAGFPFQVKALAAGQTLNHATHNAKSQAA